MKYLLYDGGKGIGGTGDEKFHECPRRFVLDQRLRRDKVPGGIMGIGTYMHCFLHLYHTDVSFDYDDLEMVDAAGNTIEDDVEARLEAERVFEDYQVHRRPDFLGDVISAEQGYGYDADDETVKLIREALGGYYRTAKTDMEVMIDEKKATWLSAWEAGLGGIKPGKYLVDNKFHKAEQGTIRDQYKLKQQFVIYQLVAQAFSIEPILGLIVNTGIVRKEPGFFCTLVQFPGRAEKKGLQNYLKGQEILREVLGQDGIIEGGWCNLAACYEYGKPCHHLVSGACKRI